MPYQASPLAGAVSDGQNASAAPPQPPRRAGSDSKIGGAHRGAIGKPFRLHLRAQGSNYNWALSPRGSPQGFLPPCR